MPILEAKIVFNTGVKKMSRTLFVSSKISQKNIQQIVMRCGQCFYDDSDHGNSEAGTTWMHGGLGRAPQVVTHHLVWKGKFRFSPKFGKWKERNAEGSRWDILNS